MDIESPTPVGDNHSLGPSLFSVDTPPIMGETSPIIARHSQFTTVQSSSHVRHQSVPSFNSPKDSPRPRQESSSRGLAKLTLVERLSRESIESPTPENGLDSPKSQSPSRFDEGPPRRGHSPRRSRMSLSIPPTKTATTPISTASPLASPLRPASLVIPTQSKHVSNGSLSEINLSPTHVTHDRAMTSPTLSSLEEVSALDDTNATFLTLIAFQERRVVELREELARAESELDLLKQQWTRQQLKLTRKDRQEHIRQNSLTKLEQQMAYAPRVERDESPQIIVVGRKFAEGVRDGFYSVVQDLKTVAANESAQTTPRQRGRSPTRRTREDLGLGIVTERVDPPLWYPKNSSPMRSIRRKSDGSDTTQETSTSLTYYAQSISLM